MPTLACGALALAGLVPAARADTPATDTGGGLESEAQGPLWELGLGVATLRVPDYRGSDQIRSYALPLPYVVYRGKFLRADRDGARALLLESDRVKVDVSVSGSVPTRSRDNTARSGMPDLAPTVEMAPTSTCAAAVRRCPHPARPAPAAARRDRDPAFAGSDRRDVLAEPESRRQALRRRLEPRPARRSALRRPPLPRLLLRRRGRAGDGEPAGVPPGGGYAGWQALAAGSRRFGRLWVGGFARYDSLRGAVFESSPLVRRDHDLTVGLGVSWVFASSGPLVPAER